MQIMIPKNCSSEQLCGKLSAHYVKNSMLVQGKLQFLHVKRFFVDPSGLVYFQGTYDYIITSIRW
jgi:hypothetical protein